MGQGRAASPGRLNVKTGPLLSDILICSILLLFSSFFALFGVSCFFSWYRLPRLPNSLSFPNFFSHCWLVPSLRYSVAPSANPYGSQWPLQVLPPWPDEKLFTQNVTTVTFILKPLQIQNKKKQKVG